MAGSPAVSSRPMLNPTTMRRKRDHPDLDNISNSDNIPNSPPSSVKSNEVIDLTTNESRLPSRKQRRIGPSNSTIPRTLPMKPHEAVLAELKGKYSIITTTVISSSKINKKVTAVLSHLGHIDMFSQDSVPGVMMLHARASEISKLVTVIELAKRRIDEIGHKWFQYNRVYEVAEEQGAQQSKTPEGRAEANGTQTVIEDTILECEVEAFEPTQPLDNLTLKDSTSSESKNKNAYMSIFLSRVPMPELQAKPSFTLQTSANQAGTQK